MTLLANLNRATRLALGALSLSLVAACGGSQVEPFRPTRMLSFGDESSLIVDSNNDANGRKYTINALKTDNVTLDCSASAVWIQYVSATFGFALPQCNPNGVASPTSRIYATAGAKAADIGAQIDTHLLSDTFVATDIVTLWVGANDILAQYALYDGTNEVALSDALHTAGTLAAAQVNRMRDLGAKVIVATAPDMGLTPFAIAEEQANAGRAALLSRLTAEFNRKLRSNLVNDGRTTGIVFADEVLQTAVKFPSTYGLVDVVTAACDTTKAATLPDCTTQTLVTNAAAGTWLWADSTHLGPAGQRLIGQLAQVRVVKF